MIRTFVLIVVLSTITAGCSGPSAIEGDAKPDDEPQAPGPVEVSQRHGGIEGSVVDTTLLPIANATVTLRESGGAGAVLSSTKTLEDGRFVFNLLDPGTYRVTATKRGFANTTQVAVVAAGEATIARLTLGDVPVEEPYVELMIQDGLISCAFAVVVVSGVCLPDQTEPVFGPYKVALFFPIPAGHQKAVSETDWPDRSQVFRNWYFHDETQDANFEGDWLGDAIGPAILRKEFTPGVVPSSFAPFQTDGVPFPASEQNFTFLGITYYDGSYQEEINGTASPVCEQNPIVGYCTGAGVALGVRFTHYVTVFVNQAPASVAAYSAVPDR